MIKVLDLFAGTQSVRKALDEMGVEYEYKGIDIYSPEEENIILDLTQDDIVNKLKEKLGDWKPDFIWASPICKPWSIAAISHHWSVRYENKKIVERLPISKLAVAGIKMLENTISIVNHYNVPYAVENPRGTMRKHPLTDKFNFRDTAMYCRYGDTRMKPTDIWSSGKLTLLKCKNGNPDHVSAPRGARTGTQGLKEVERSAVPPKLIKEIIKQLTGVNND